MWLKDPKTGQGSVTITILMTTVIVALTKLLFSGIIIGDLTMSSFSGTDFAAVVGAAGALYAARKHTDNTKNKD